MANEKTLKATIKLVDNYTKPMVSATKQTQAYQKIVSKIKPLILKVKDMASKQLNAVKGKIDKIKSIKQVQTMLKAVDKASKVVNKVGSGLKKLGGMVVRSTVKVLDKASSMINAIKGKLVAIGSMVVTATVGVGFKGLAEEENQKLTINRVIQNSGKSKEEAKKSTAEYYKYLEDYANKTPFTTAEVAGFGTKGMMMAKGNVDNAKSYTDAMANVKAFVGENRTALEVSDAFFSAQNGNMDSLNNMLGTSYESFEEALKGVAKNQGGLVDEMSQTTGGLFSTIVGKAQVGAKQFIKAFEEPLKNGMKNIAGFIDVASENMVNFANRLTKIDFKGLFASFDFSAMTTALSPVIELMDSFFTGIETKSPVTMGIMQILGTLWSTTWSMIGSAIEAVKPIIEKVFVFIGEHGEEISNVVKGMGSVWDMVWGTVGPLLQGAWAIVEPILSRLIGFLSDVSDMIQNVGKWWTDMVNKIKNNPIVASVSNAWNAVTGKGSRSAFGTNRVSRNDTPYRLHQGERVLTRQEADRYDKGTGNSSVVVNVNGMTIREEADIDRVASALVRKINQNRIVLG